MGGIESTRGSTRRRLSLMASLGLVGCSLLFGAGTASAEPSTPTTLTYHFFDCTGPHGTPPTFDAVKQPGGAAALHLVDANGIFVVMGAVDVASGAVLFMTPGFAHNDLPTVACRAFHPSSGALQQVTGIMTPLG